MKVLTLRVFLLLIIFLNACGSITVRKDKFSGTTLVSMSRVHFSESFFAGRMEAYYVKEFSGNAGHPAVVNMKLTTPVTYKFPDKSLQVKIDDNIFIVPIHEISSEIYTTYEDGMVNRYRLYYAESEFSSEIEDKLQTAGSVSYRIEMGGGKNITYKFSSEDVKKIKEFLATRPE